MISEAKESVVQLSVSNNKPFTDHPFEIRDDDAMKDTVTFLQ